MIFLVAVLVDTGVLYAIYDTSDSHHNDSIALMLHALGGRWGKVFTTNYIVLESTLLLGARRTRAVARALPRFVASSGVTEIVVDKGLHAKALELFQSEESLSLTDAASTLLIGILSINTLFTFDRRKAVLRTLQVWTPFCSLSPIAAYRWSLPCVLS